MLRQKQSYQIICRLRWVFPFSSPCRSTLISFCRCGREELKLFELAPAVLADVSAERKKRSADTAIQRGGQFRGGCIKRAAFCRGRRSFVAERAIVHRDTRIHVARIIQLWHGKKYHRPDWIVKTFYSRLHALSRPQK